MKIDELKKYHGMIVAYWDFFREYSTPDSSDDFWKRCSAEALRIRKEYAGTDDELARMLAVAFLSAIQRIYRRKVQVVDSA